MDSIDRIRGFGGWITSFFYWLFKWMWTKEKISRKVIVSLCAQKNAISIDCSVNPSISVYVQVRNYTPFEQKLDNLIVEFVQSGVSIKLRYDRKHKVPPFSENQVYLNDNLTIDHAQKIALANDSYGQARVSYHADFSNRLYEFSLSGSLESPPIEKINIHFHQEKKVS